MSRNVYLRYSTGFPPAFRTTSVASSICLPVAKDSKSFGVALSIYFVIENSSALAFPAAPSLEDCIALDQLKDKISISLLWFLSDDSPGMSLIFINISTAAYASLNENTRIVTNRIESKIIWFDKVLPQRIWLDFFVCFNIPSKFCSSASTSTCILLYIAHLYLCKIKMSYVE